MIRSSWVMALLLAAILAVLVVIASRMPELRDYIDGRGEIRDLGAEVDVELNCLGAKLDAITEQLADVERAVRGEARERRSGPLVLLPMSSC